VIRRPALALAVAAAASSAAVLLAPARAAAQATPQPPPQLDVSWARDGIITGAAAAVAGLAALIPVDTSTRWSRQLVPFDDGLEGRLSVSASSMSDAMLTIDVAMPVGLLVGQGGLTEANDRRLLIYAESLGVSLALNSVTKYLVGRPRPYVYSDDPRVKAYAASQGKDSHLSFFSGHASTTFTASVAGAYLYSQAATDKTSRAAVWGFELALAAATARMRTRAGKHFYSDVIVGTIVGAGVGFLVPRLHGGPVYSPSAAEWIVIGVAPLAGIGIGQILPAQETTIAPLTPIALPYIVPGGGGIIMARRF
jgi:membrane-associated phospholipid phosphatase